MPWFNRPKSEQGFSKYKSPIAEKWDERGNAFAPIQGKQYEWVWEYAQLRYAKAMEFSRYVEEKSIAMLKFISAVGAAAWVIFAYLGAKSFRCPTPVGVILAVAVLCVILSAIFAVWALKPVQHLYAKDEDTAIKTIDRSEDKQQALTRFALALAASTEFEHEEISKKGRKVNSSILLLTASIVLFMIVLFWAVFP